MHSESTNNPPPRSKLGCVALCIVGILIGGLISLGVRKARSDAVRNDCANNFKQIGLALLNYESSYHRFPQAYWADANGKPMHSWRISIVPYLESPNIFHQYDFKEPWNGPHNRKFSAQNYVEFRCPAAGTTSNDTNYVVVGGPLTGWPPSTRISRHDIRDKGSQTIMLVEADDTGINWLEPRDMTFEQAMKGINPPATGLKISSHHVGGANVGFFDLHVSFLGDDCSPEVLRSLLTISGGETVKIPDVKIPDN
jgi:prepilin-type processing-associated H-X9-DG protein